MGNVKWIELLGWLLLWITCRLALATGWFTIPSLILLVTVPLKFWYMHIYLIFSKAWVSLYMNALAGNVQKVPIKKFKLHGRVQLHVLACS